MNKKSPRLKTLAAKINASSKFLAEIERGYGKNTNRLIVRNAGKLVFTHNAALPYRTNSDIVYWMKQNGIEVN